MKQMRKIFVNYPLYYKKIIIVLIKIINQKIYFDPINNRYSLCYQLCKTCKKNGNENINNCESCIDGYIFLNETNSSKSKKLS